MYDSIDNEILEIFKNIDHDFRDGVSEEMMKHLKVVKQNIEQIKIKMIFMVGKLQILEVL